MPNSDANITRSALVSRAFRRIGVQSPTTNETADAVSLLNHLLKGLDQEGRWLWAVSNTQTTLNLVAGTRSYAAGTAPTGIASTILKLESVEIVQGTSLTPIQIIDKTTSLTTVLREGTGQPVAVFLEVQPLLANQSMHFFQTPDSSYTVKYNFRRRLYDFDSASDNPDFPADWIQRLVKLLSYELAPEFGVPLQEREILRMEAESAINKGLSTNAESGAAQPVPTVYY